MVCTSICLRQWEKLGKVNAFYIKGSSDLTVLKRCKMHVSALPMHVCLEVSSCTGCSLNLAYHTVAQAKLNSVCCIGDTGSPL